MTSLPQTQKRRRTVFRPCIDIHDGQVKQIVGSSLSDIAPASLKTNYVSPDPPSYFAELYRSNNIRGGHIIKLGPCPENDSAALSALQAWPNALQIGGGINASNAKEWIKKGAEKVIVTSWLFPEGKFNLERLKTLNKIVGKERLVVDLSCRRIVVVEQTQDRQAKMNIKWVVAMNRWQTLTDMEINKETLAMLAEYCIEFLIHAADVEGLCNGIDVELVKLLGEWTPISCTYAGGASSISDLQLVQDISNGRVDVTIGSALDIFGGHRVRFVDCVEWNRKAEESQ